MEAKTHESKPSDLKPSDPKPSAPAPPADPAKPSPLSTDPKSGLLKQPATLHIIFKIIDGSAKPSAPQFFYLFDPPAWIAIKAFLAEIAFSEALDIDIILKYFAKICQLSNNSKNDDVEQFVPFRKFLEHYSSEYKLHKAVGESDSFISLFKSVAQLALRLDEYFPDGKIPLLNSEQTCIVSRKVAATREC